MREIALYGKYGEGKFALVDDENYKWLNQYRWVLVLSDRNSRSGKTWWYVRRSVKGNSNKKVYMHREVMGNPEGVEIDHKNHNLQDNRKENLRPCTFKENRRYAKWGGYGTSKYNGVSLYSHVYKNNKRKWRAQIKVDNKLIHLGYFDGEIDAALAYDKAAVKYFGDFAYLNFPAIDLWDGT